jgi:hypothetical protein
MRLRGSECCYCGAPPPTTRDHVPMRTLFPPKCSDLITVPCCKACNSRHSADEEYFMNVLLSLAEADTPVAREVRKRFIDRGATPRRRNMARRMLGSMGTAPVVTPAGVYLRHAPTFTIDAEPCERVVEKITRGLYFYEFNERAPLGRPVEVILRPTLEMENPTVMAVGQYGRGREVGRDAFRYRIDRAPELTLPGVAMCVMWFFGTIPMICSLLRPEAG